MLSFRHLGLTAAAAALAAFATGSPAQAQITEYTDQAAFTAAAPGLPALDFAAANTSGSTITDYGTAAGLTLGGVNFTATTGGAYQMSAVAPDFYPTYGGWDGNPTVLAGMDYTILLPVNTTAVGTDLYTVHVGDSSLNTAAPVDFVFFSGASQIGSFTETTFTKPTLAFAGFTSTQAITSIQVTAENGCYTDLSSFAFGTPAAVPEASTTVSFGLLLALGLGGVVISARRKAKTSA